MVKNPQIVEDVVRASVANQSKKRIGQKKLLAYTKKTLLYLVKCAKNQKHTDYTTLSRSIGINNTRSANVAFGAINQIRRSLSEGGKFHTAVFSEIPDITTIVTHMGKRTCGDGVITHGHPSALSDDEKSKIVEQERQRAFSFQKWEELLAFLDIGTLD